MREKTEQTIQEKEEELTVGSCFVFFIYFFNVAIIFLILLLFRLLLMHVIIQTLLKVNNGG